jgi:hypothetical protein
MIMFRSVLGNAVSDLVERAQVVEFSMMKSDTDLSGLEPIVFTTWVEYKIESHEADILDQILVDDGRVVVSILKSLNMAGDIATAW